MYAIVRTGGKQYTVREGSVLLVEKLAGEPGSSIELEEVLLVQGESGLHVGAPHVDGAKIHAEILDQESAKKVNGFTYKAKKNVRKRYGHRQQLTRLRVTSIEQA